MIGWKRGLVVAGLVGTMLVPSAAEAHPGRTDSSGGHTCRTNCPSWGLAYGQYHYHNGGVSSGGGSGGGSGGQSGGGSSTGGQTGGTQPSSPPVPKPDVGDEAADITIRVNGQVLALPTPARVKQNRTMVPMRAIFQALGATVNWDDATQTATGVRGPETVKVTIGSSTAWVNGLPQTLDVPPFLYGGSTLVPVRFVSEGLGAAVRWDEATRTIDIDLAE